MCAPAPLKCLLEIAEPSHILFGSDFPFSRHRTPAKDVESSIAAFEAFGDWDAATRQGIESKNALRLFPRLAKRLDQRTIANARSSLKNTGRGEPDTGERWWARKDSNLQPSGYERATLPGKVSNYWHFRARLVTSVRVWLPRFIGYPLVEHESQQSRIPRFDADSVPDDPVYLEPVSALNSLITGKNTGNFAKLGRLRLRKSRIVSMQWGRNLQIRESQPLLPCYPHAVALRGVPSLAQSEQSLKLPTGHGSLHLVFAVHALIGPDLRPVALKGVRSTAGEKCVATALLAASRQCKLLSNGRTAACHHCSHRCEYILAARSTLRLHT